MVAELVLLLRVAGVPRGQGTVLASARSGVEVRASTAWHGVEVGRGVCWGLHLKWPRGAMEFLTHCLALPCIYRYSVVVELN